MNVTYLCLGGNIGDREKALQLALLKIEEQVGKITAVSTIYETEAWGVEDQQPYLNQCIEVRTELIPLELINKLLSIEKELGRERTISQTYEPRTLDIDILLYNQDIIDTAELTVPHPRLHLRKFVLIPLVEICPDLLHPLLNKTIFKLLTDCEDRSEVTPFKTHH
ncbi:MAG: 2-amino-4-hydroxy-6-hydroxymethyldihydropteridine diphosphokinase [Bacteroidota bacterium]